MFHPCKALESSKPFLSFPKAKFTPGRALPAGSQANFGKSSRTPWRSQSETIVSDNDAESYQLLSHQLDVPVVPVQDSIASLNQWTWKRFPKVSFERPDLWHRAQMPISFFDIQFHDFPTCLLFLKVNFSVCSAFWSLKEVALLHARKSISRNGKMSPDRKARLDKSKSHFGIRTGSIFGQ